MSEAASAALFRSGICQGIDPSAAQTLEGLLTPIRFRRHQDIFTEGEPGDRLFVISTGRVRISQTASDGRETMLMLAGPSDVIGALSLFDPGARTTTARTLTDVDAEAMDRTALQAWITRCPEISEQLLRVLARRLRRTNSMISDRIFTDVPGRLAKTLLGMAREIGTRIDTPHGPVIHVEHHMNQTDLADFVGASRETVNKALSDFAARGWLRQEPGGVDILQPDRLARRAR